MTVIPLSLTALLPAHDTFPDFLFSFPPPFCPLYPSFVPVLFPIPFPPFLSVTCSYWSLFADWWFLIGSGHFSFKCLGAFCSGSQCKLLPILILVCESLALYFLPSFQSWLFFFFFICVCVFLTACSQSHHCCIPFFLFKCEMFVLFGGSN